MRRIEFLERELDAAKAGTASADALRSELKQREDECRELHEAIEELETGLKNEVQRAVGVARLEWQLCYLGDGDGGDTATTACAPSDLELASPGGEGNPVGDSDSEREREVSREQLEILSEERDLLQHRCCDAEEKNRRLERELHRIMDIQRQLDVKFHQYQMEHQIVLEMETRNQQWRDSPSSNGGLSEPQLANSECGGGRCGLRASTQLLTNNTVEYLSRQLEGRDAEIRALQLQLQHRRSCGGGAWDRSDGHGCGDSTAAADSNQTHEMLAQEVIATKDELAESKAHIRFLQASVAASMACPGAPGDTDMAVYRQIKSEMELCHKMLERVCVVVPDDKRTVQEAVLLALEEGKAVFIRRGIYKWGKSAIKISGHLRLFAEDGVVMQGSWDMGESSSGLMEGAVCESGDVGNVLHVHGGRWVFRKCVFRAFRAGTEVCEEGALRVETDDERKYEAIGQEESVGGHVVVVGGEADATFQSCHVQLCPTEVGRGQGEGEGYGKIQCGMVVCGDAEVILMQGSTRDQCFSDGAVGGGGGCRGCAIFFRDRARGDLRRWECEGFRYVLGLDHYADVHVIEGCVLRGEQAFRLGAALTPDASLEICKGNRLVCRQLTGGDFEEVRALLNRSAASAVADLEDDASSWILDERPSEGDGPRSFGYVTDVKDLAPRHGVSDGWEVAPISPQLAANAVSPFFAGKAAANSKSVKQAVRPVIVALESLETHDGGAHSGGARSVTGSVQLSSTRLTQSSGTPPALADSKLLWGGSSSKKLSQEELLLAGGGEGGRREAGDVLGYPSDDSL